jgi:hypothetical protein
MIDKHGASAEAVFGFSTLVFFGSKQDQSGVDKADVLKRKLLTLIEAIDFVQELL